jgi:hypothetical protein
LIGAAAERRYVGQTVDIGEAWRVHFGDLPAVAHLMRGPLAARWLRIHSLPNSKRYAEGDGDCAELLRRHNEAASEILGSGDAILFVHAWGGIDSFSSVFANFVWAAQTDLATAKAVLVPNSESPDESLVVAGCLISWSAGHWDPLLRDVADDRLSSIVLFNPRSGEVYAPYDGGADIFVAKATRVGELRDRWRAWLSPRPDGL